MYLPLNMAIFAMLGFRALLLLTTAAAAAANATLLGTMKFSNDRPCSKPTSIRLHQSWPKLRFFHYSGIL